MVGRQMLDALFPERGRGRARSCSRSSDLTREGVFTDISLHVRAGRDRRAGRAGRAGPQRGGPGRLRHRPLRRGHGDGAAARSCRKGVAAGRDGGRASASCPRTGASRAWSWTCRSQQNVALASLARLRHGRPDPVRRPSAAFAADWAQRLQLKYGRLHRPGVHAVRRQPAEGRPGQVAGPPARAADRRRADPRHRRRHQGRGAPAAGAAGRGGGGRPDDLLGAARRCSAWPTGSWSCARAG